MFYIEQIGNGNKRSGGGRKKKEKKIACAYMWVCAGEKFMNIFTLCIYTFIVNIIWVEHVTILFIFVQYFTLFTLKIRYNYIFQEELFSFV